MEDNQFTRAIIGAAIEVHKRMGPGLLESAYRVDQTAVMFRAGLVLASTLMWIKL